MMCSLHVHYGGNLREMGKCGGVGTKARFTLLLFDKHLSKLKQRILNHHTQLEEGICSAGTLPWRDDGLHFSSKLEVGGGRPAIPALKNGWCEQHLCCLKV